MTLGIGLIKLAALACGVELAVYWGTVLVKSWRIASKIGKDPNMVPRERVGQWMRVLWGPAVLAWCIQPWLFGLAAGFGRGQPPWILASVAGTGLMARLLAAAGAGGGAVCLGLTFICWRQMGRSWRIGIDPGEKTELVVRGAYRFVRHPIYSLSMFLMIGTVLAVPTPLMFLTALVHISMLQVEARREEGYLIKLHGSHYEKYRQTVGRFLPRPWKQ